MIILNGIKDPDLMWKVEQMIKDVYSNATEDFQQNIIDNFEEKYVMHGEYISISLDPITGIARLVNKAH